MIYEYKLIWYMKIWQHLKSWIWGVFHPKEKKEAKQLVKEIIENMEKVEKILFRAKE